jgi:hypothetical protein
MNLMMIPKFFLLFLSLLKNKNVLAMLYKTIYHNLLSLISHNQEDIYVMTGLASLSKFVCFINVYKLNPIMYLSFLCKIKKKKNPLKLLHIDLFMCVDPLFFLFSLVFSMPFVLGIFFVFLVIFTQPVFRSSRLYIHL